MSADTPDLAVGLHHLTAQAQRGEPYAAAVLAHLERLRQDLADAAREYTCLETLATALANALSQRLGELQCTRSELDATRARLRLRTAELADCYAELRESLRRRRQTEAQLAELRQRLPAQPGTVPDRTTIIDFGHGWRLERVHRTK